ncbi:MAG: citrate/2-methylcitrate synthase [Nannocystaceae bacterium]
MRFGEPVLDLDHGAGRGRHPLPRPRAVAAGRGPCRLRARRRAVVVRRVAGTGAAVDGIAAAVGATAGGDRVARRCDPAAGPGRVVDRAGPRRRAHDDDAIAGARALVATLAHALGWPPVAPRGRTSTTVAERCALALVRRCATQARRDQLALVVSADHELNASAFRVRVAASTGADLAASVAAGLHVMSGPRHGAASRVLSSNCSRAPVHPRVCPRWCAAPTSGERVPGFGHPIYPAGDPRVPPLLACARDGAALAATPGSRSRRCCRWPSAAATRNLDAGLVAITIACGLPPGTAAGLFALGRTAGWIAHALEQRAAGFILRPRARYVGP